jgi:hypothetical protein
VREITSDAVRSISAVPIRPLELDPAEQRLVERRLRKVNLVGAFAGAMLFLSLVLAILH